MVEEVKIRVNMDVQSAEKSIKSMDKSLRSSARSAGTLGKQLKRGLGVGLGIAAAPFAGVIGQGAGAISTVIGQAAGATPFGRAVGGLAAGITAQNAARQATIEALGIVGQNIPEQAVIDFFKGQETLLTPMELGRDRIDKILAEFVTGRTVEQIMAAIEKLLKEMSLDVTSITAFILGGELTQALTLGATKTGVLGGLTER